MTTTTRAAALGRPHHHHQLRSQPQAPGAGRELEAGATMIELEPANRSDTKTQTPNRIQTTTTTIKHERISLKKLHSLRNQLFCGFKSFSSSNEQPERQFDNSKAQVETAYGQQASKLPKISGANDDRLSAGLGRQLEQATGAKLEDCNSSMMTVDQQLQNASLSASGAGGFSNRTSRGGSKSSSWASLSTTQHQRQLTSDQQQQQQEIACQLGALLTKTGSNDEESRGAGGSGKADGCSLKRASFRRLTGRSARNKQAPQSSEEQQQPEKMLKLIGQLDLLTKLMADEPEGGQARSRTNEDEDIFYLEKSWTNFVHLDKIQDEDCCCCSQARNRQQLDSEKEAAAAAKCPSAHLKPVQQDAIWELLTSEIDPARLASNIEEVHRANCVLWTKSLLPMLMRSRLTGCPLDPSAMKDGFARIATLFGSYSRYCLEHRACLDYLRDTNKHDQYFKIYLAWCESQKDCERLRLMDLLAKPMQRLTKYPLLLKAIYRRTDDSKQLADLREMIIGMEKFVLTVDLRLHDNDKLEQLSLTADRIESLDIGSSDTYCDEVNRIIGHYCRQFQLCRPLFGCAFGCSRRLLFDSSQLAAANNHLGQIKFKDSQLSSKQDVVLLLFTDQLLVCKQASHRWYSGGGASQERSPANSKSFKSSMRQLQRSSTKSAGSTKAASWIKTRSGSGNHLVDSLILANNDRAQSSTMADKRRQQQQQQQPRRGALLSAHSNGSGRHASFHLSTSSLAGSAAREHFVISKSAEGSRSGESFAQQSPTRPQQAASSRLRAIRSPYPIDRLVLHELNDGNRLLCCQLNDSGTIATSFVLHVDSAANSDSLKTKVDTNSTPAVKLTSAGTAESGAVASDQSAMHHLSPLSGLAARAGSSRLSSASQQTLSPARRLINLIEQTQLRYKTAASFHGIPLAHVDILGEPRQQQRSADCEMLNWTPITSRREKLDSSPTRSISSVSRSSEQFVEANPRERPIIVMDENSNWLEMPDASDDSAADFMKVILEEEQSMLLKHGKYDDLQTAACKMDPRLALIRQQQQQQQRFLGQTATGSLASPFLSVSSDEHRLHVQCANSQNSVFESDNKPERRNVNSQTEPPTDSNPSGAQTFDRQRVQSWSCNSADRKQLASISGSDIESTTSDILPLAGECLSPDQTSPSRASRQRTAATTKRRRQVNHLRRQNDIVSSSHDQQETYPASGYAGNRSSVSFENSGQSLESTSQPANETADSTRLSQHRRYLSLARRLMMQEQKQPGSSQATTMDLASMTLNDNQAELSLDSAEVESEPAVHSRAVSIELGNLRARLSFCAPTNPLFSTASQPASSSLPEEEENHRRLRNTRPVSEDKIDHHQQQQQRRRRSQNSATTVDNSEMDAANGSSADDSFAEGRRRLEVASSGFSRCETGGLKLGRHGSSLDQRSFSKNDDETWNSSEQVIDSLHWANNAPDQPVSVPLLNVTSADSPHLVEAASGAELAAEQLEGQEETCADIDRCRRPPPPEVRARNLRQMRGPGDECCSQPAALCNQGISMNSLDATNKDVFNGYDGRRPSRGEKGWLDGEQASISYKGNLLELQCIHKLIHQDEAQCGRRVYLGFYEKLDLHLKQAADSKSAGRTRGPPDAATQPLANESNHASPADMKHRPPPAGRSSPARSDSSASKKVRSIRVFTNDLIGSLMRATSSCSVHFSKK